MFTYNQLLFPSHSEKNTRFLAIAGFSNSGPAKVPFVLKEGVDPAAVLGSGLLAENVKKAIRYGITPLVYRMNGKHAECVLVHEERGTDFLRFTSINATDEVNNLQLHVFPTHLVINGLSQDKTYYFGDFQRTDDLVRRIQEDLQFNGGEVEVQVIQSLPLTGICLTEKHIPFTGGDNEYNLISQSDESDSSAKRTEQLAALKECLLEEADGEFYHTSELDPYHVDTFLFTDVPYDEAETELAEIVGRFARSKTREQAIFCSAVLGTSAFRTTRYGAEGEDRYAEEIQRLMDKAATDRSQDYWKHIEVIVGSENVASPDIEALSCAGDYAFMRYRLPSYHMSATNKEIKHIGTLFNEELQKDEVAKLITSGYICIVPSIRRGFVPYASKNLLSSDTLQNSPHVLRSVHFDAYRVAGFFGEYLGAYISDTTFQAIYGRAQTFVEQLKENHPLYRDIELAILDYNEEKVTVSLSFGIYGEVENVFSSFVYTPSGEVSFL